MIFNYLKESATKHPDRFAIADKTGTYDFQSLYDESQSIRHDLQNAGIRKDHRVALVCDNGFQFVAALFSVASTEAILIPVYHGLSTQERNEIYTKCSVQYIIGKSELLKNEIAEFDGLKSNSDLQLLQVDQRQANPFEQIPNATFVRFSSGTTGKMKGVVLSAEMVDQRTEAVFQSLKLEEIKNVCWVLPMAYHFIATIVTFVRYGIGMTCTQSFFADEIMDKLDQHNCDMLYVSPMHIRLLNGLHGADTLHNIKQVISTSSGISSEDCEAFWNRYGIRVKQAYGIIEVGIPLVNHESPSNGGMLGEVQLPYHGAILDEQGRELGDGEEGMLALKGPGMFDAYAIPYAARVSVLSNDWFLTGDLAIRNADGVYELKGRQKSMINVGGNKVFPEEVEFALEQIDGISEAHVTSRLHPTTGESVHADISLDEGTTLEVDEILLLMRDKLTAYKLPKSIEFVEQIEKTSTGKKQRH